MTYLMELRDVDITMKKKQILDSVNFNFEKGKIYGLLGPNGAGKTTFLKSILGVFKPTSGKVYFKGEDIYKNPVKNLMREMGSIIEFPGFYGNLTLKENIYLHMKYHNIEPEEKHIDNLLKFASLYKHRDKLFSQTSLGMKQRMGIVRSIANDPALLLLDEPTNGLDPQGIKQVREMLIQEVELNDRTIIVSSHLLNEISIIADKLIFMNEGKIILTTENKEEINLIKVKVKGYEGTDVKQLLESEGIQVMRHQKGYAEIITSVNTSELLKKIGSVVEVDDYELKRISLEDLYLYLLSDTDAESTGVDNYAADQK